MIELCQAECCGIYEMDGVQSPSSAEQALLEAATQWFGGTPRAYIFYSTVEGNKGQEITAYIRKNKLGSVVKMPTRLNPNTSNMLTMWIWAVNNKKFREWWDKNKSRLDGYDYDEDEDDY